MYKTTAKLTTGEVNTLATHDDFEISFEEGIMGQLDFVDFLAARAETRLPPFLFFSLIYLHFLLYSIMRIISMKKLLNKKENNCKSYSPLKISHLSAFAGNIL